MINAYDPDLASFTDDTLFLAEIDCSLVVDSSRRLSEPNPRASPLTGAINYGPETIDICLRNVVRGRDNFGPKRVESRINIHLQ